MKCRVVFDNGRADGRFSSEGELNCDGNAFSLEYVLDGDKCRLCYRGGILTQRRCGKVNLDRSFSENAETGCIIKDGDASGRIDIFTGKLNAVTDEGGVKVFVDYTLGGERNTLRISAEAVN